MKKRVRHVVTEIERVRSFVRAFASGDIEAAGCLFNASHDSLAADYEVTVPELDVAVDVARKNGAYGARMTGGGFGGSIIALVDKGRSQEVAQKIADEFEKQGFHAPRACRVRGEIRFTRGMIINHNAKWRVSSLYLGSHPLFVYDQGEP